MRLENLHGYLKFPGPLPVASIRLRYVNRPATAARFAPREGDGTKPGGGPDGAGNAPDAAVAAPGENVGIAIPALPDGSGAGPGEPSPAWEDAPEPSEVLAEPDLVPLPDEAEDAETDPEPDAPTGPGKNAREGTARPGAARGADTDGGAALRGDGEAPQGAAGPEPQAPPTGAPAINGGDAGDPEAGPKREWL